MKSTTSISLLVLAAKLAKALPPSTGPLLPQPLDLLEQSTFKSATANLTNLLEDAVRGGVFSPNASFSVVVTAGSAPKNDPVLWDFHHLAPNRSPNGTKDIGGSSQYMIGSITKVITDLLVLKSGIDIHASVTKYLPELNEGASAPNASDIPWNSITVLDLMSHLSGIPQNYGFPEIFQLVPLYQALGFPSLNETDFPSCGVTGLNSGCSPSQLLMGLGSHVSKSVFPPGYSPAYNNIAFALLGIILERTSGQTFSELISAQITGPLNMTSTDSLPGNSAAAVIPSGDSSWGADFGVNAPQGGMHSSTNDLAKFARAILASSHLILDEPNQINEWLKPRALLPGLGNAVGAPWEIYRTDELLPNQTVDIYAKDGGVVSYFSRMALLPKYGVGVICLTAGPVGTLDAIMETAMSVIVPAVDQVAKEEANTSYAGSYLAVQGGVDSVQANLTLEVDDRVGLHVAGLYRNNSNILEAIEIIYASGVVVAGDLNPNWRMYPAGIVHEATITNQNNEQEQVLLEDWRLGFETTSFPQPPGPLMDLDRRVFKDAVASWQGLDSMYYGGRAVDRIVAIKSADGSKVIGFMAPALRVTMWKTG